MNMALSLTAFAWPLQFCAFTTFATYIASVITSNVSQVDRLWTFLPTIYTAYFALLPLWPRSQPFPLFPFVPDELGFAAEGYSPRVLLMLSLVVLWMFRLSYNTYRRGLFSLKDEDYRWAVLRTQLPPWLFQVVNLTFIAGIQNVLLMLLGVPAYIASSIQSHDRLTPSDYICTASALLVLALEFTADNQQYAYQTFKYAYLAESGGKVPAKKYHESEQWPGAKLNWTSEDANRGFVTKGLWAYSRHPNFACEQTFWWIITLFPVVAGPPPQVPIYSTTEVWNGISALLNYIRATSPSAIFTSHNLSLAWQKTLTHLPAFSPLLPAVCLSILFFSSTAYTEAITESKYPLAYAAYKRRVSMFSPGRTLEKYIRLRLFASNEESRKIDELVFGAGKGKAKAE